MTRIARFKELRPLREGMFVLDADGSPVALSGSRCAGCGRVHFPARRLCGACPPGTALHAHRLSTRGVVYTSTVVHVRSALGHRAPFAYGYVDLPDDATRIFAPFVIEAGRDLKPGSAVVLTFAEIDAEAMPGVLGYAFAPATGDADV